MTFRQNSACIGPTDYWRTLHLFSIMDCMSLLESQTNTNWIRRPSPWQFMCHYVFFSKQWGQLHRCLDQQASVILLSVGFFLCNMWSVAESRSSRTNIVCAVHHKLGAGEVPIRDYSWSRAKNEFLWGWSVHSRLTSSTWFCFALALWAESTDQPVTDSFLAAIYTKWAARVTL